MSTQLPAQPPQPVLPAPRKPLARAWMLTALLGLAALALWVDLPLAQLLHSETTPSIDDLFEDIGDMADTTLFVVGALAVYGGALWRMRHDRLGRWLGIAYERWVRGSLLVLATMTLGGLVTLVLKQVVARARPEVFFEQGFYGLGLPFSGDPFNSFPSSHTLTAFAVAAALAKLAPALRWPLFLFAAAVGLSRLVNLDHYLSDVVMAAGVAIASAGWLAPRVLDSRYQWPVRLPWHWGRKG
ncbi:phosphatase PAP2 family protein [Orrella sp. JC864]|uniref:phosphatase PAP2 family protein n=1 Tax=Orrella sp. JC864 TaxID=3120298 RepID=UPI0030093640